MEGTLLKCASESTSCPPLSPSDSHLLFRYIILLDLHVSVPCYSRQVADLGWNANDCWVLASVAEDNILQVWQMAENIYADDADEQHSDGDDANVE